MKLFKIFIIFYAFNISAQVENNIDWKTTFEKSNFFSTSSYNETIDYFAMLEQNSPYAKLKTFGVSPQGRELKYLVISKRKHFEPSSIDKSSEAVILINNGIHSGEIEGKDASMLMLREILITKEKEALLENVILLVVPIFNVDGHERTSKFNRINQNGPIEMGWRTTSQNLNLNRDFVKADTPEMQAFLKFFSEWMPDLFIDTHTTDGADYQYHITYEISKGPNVYSRTASFVKEKIIPFIEEEMHDKGFLIAPYVGFKGENPESGLIDWISMPRLSNGYANAQNKIGLLIETHMIKPYKERVFSTKALLLLVLEFANLHHKEISELCDEADIEVAKHFAINRNYFPTQYKLSTMYENFLFKGIKFKEDSSWISGTKKIEYTGEKYDVLIPYFNKFIVTDSVQAPSAYIIPPEWNIVSDRLCLHGIKMDKLRKDTMIVITKYKFYNIKFNSSPYEGRFPVTVDYNKVIVNEKIRKGSVIIKTNQRTIKLILAALEPKSPDSFIRWGFMNQIFERKEYFENYVMEKIAEEMIKTNLSLKSEFDKKLFEDEKFRNDPNARLNFFYEKSPYFDSKLNEYPIFRVENSF
jgi:murein tripeptide amidase MpaA